MADRTVGGPLLVAACLAGVVLAVTAGWHKYQKYRRDGAEKAGQNVGPNEGSNAGILSLLIVPVIGYFLLASRMSPYLVVSAGYVITGTVIVLPGQEAFGGMRMDRTGNGNLSDRMDRGGAGTAAGRL